MLFKGNINCSWLPCFYVFMMRCHYKNIFLLHMYLYFSNQIWNYESCFLFSLCFSRSCSWCLNCCNPAEQSHVQASLPWQSGSPPVSSEGSGLESVACPKCSGVVHHTVCDWERWNWIVARRNSEEIYNFKIALCFLCRVKLECRAWCQYLAFG